ncbi:hypothetical protein ZEAMMB73_Zm00001d004424 [Zea mays]|uniref:DUF4220 domain-containing protein n=1 Tax=Zea mays TaxID=4577 RepID=A0A1D6EFB5_MAIZE|nr:hypothetical protein ZEAMMB73_Zm00001d004424 [Zea mays]
MANFGPHQLGDTRLVEPRVAAGRLLDFWNAWATEILVILSLTQQVALLFFSGIRRQQGRSLKRLFLWLAYQLADSTAIYALGTLSLISTLRQHRLVAFWAPFLLLHLAGPDNITAYSLEDNKLWKRHLLTLVVQVLGAGYVIYNHIAGGGILFSLGAALMTAVAVAKFCEKRWALRCANFGVIRESLEAEDAEQLGKCALYLEGRAPRGGFKGKVVEKEEFLMLRTHAVFRVCMSAMVDSSENPGSYIVDILRYLKEKEMRYMWTLVEMELSLMYDILYTKAPVLHTLPGYCIRVVSPLAVVASLLLFQFYGREEGDRTADVAITYALLGSAFLMETTALLSALWSTWTFFFLCATRWSGYGMPAVGVPDSLKDSVVTCICIEHMVKRAHINTPGMVRASWGTETLRSWQEEKGISIDSKFLGSELQEGIIIWHIATDVFLARRQAEIEGRDKVEEV